jgi:hypothetical protein
MTTRTPAGVGALQNWNNVNPNKPEEYSSEFTLDGNRYANVTNSSTGQRQLYYIQPISNQRGLLTTTNTNGTIEKGENYNNFAQFQGVDKLKSAETASKQASVKLLSTPGVSTPAEAASIKASPQFKSTAAGNNAATGGSGGVGVGTDTGGTPGDSISKSGTLDTPGTGGTDEGLRYPKTLNNMFQDVIKFSMLKYEPGGIPTPGAPSVNRAKSAGGRVIGTVFLPVPNGISDTTSATWGENTLNAVDAALAGVAFEAISNGIGSGVGAASRAITAAAGDPGTKKAIGAGFAAAAASTNQAALLSRAEGQVINPNVELLFTGPSLRPFSFTFKLAARSPDEGKEIIKILRFFKQGMSPIRTESNLFLKAPNTFKIEYLHMGKDNPNIGKIKECALQSVTTNYTPEGQYMTYDEGVMVSYQLTMQFSELEPVFNDDYAGLPGIGY